MDKLCYIDFEFIPGPALPKTLVCMSAQWLGQRYDFWLLDDVRRDDCVVFLHYVYQLGGIFCAYAAQAEMSCFKVLPYLGLNYAPFICLRVESLPFVYGSPKYARFFDEEEISNFASDDKKGRKSVKKSANLVGATEYFCGIRRDFQLKKDMRSLIIAGGPYSEQDKKDIMNYCWEDVETLPQLYKGIERELGKDINQKAAMRRARTLWNYLEIACNGIPFDMILLEKIADRKTEIEIDKIEECNKFWLENKFSPPYFLENGKYKCRYCDFASFLEKSGLAEQWPKSEHGQYKRDDTTLRMFKYNKNIDVFRKTKQLISDLRMLSKDTSNKKSKKFFDHIHEGKQIPYYNPYGSITSRFQPPASCFIFGSPSWMRIFIQPPSGHTIISMDFGAQEVWVAAVMSNDRNLLQDYFSEDIYLAFGKACGLVPKDATKKSHPKERNVCKAVILGLQFGMGKAKLASQACVTEIEAFKYISAHKARYHRFWAWRKSFLDTHAFRRRSYLPDGWILMDNRAHKKTEIWDLDEHYATTTGNFPIQGTGAWVLREFVDRFMSEKGNLILANCKIIATVHDEVVFQTCLGEDLIPEIIKQITLFTDRLLTELFKLPFNTRPCKVAFDVQKHGEYCVEDKGKDALRRLFPYLGLPEIRHLLS